MGGRPAGAHSAAEEYDRPRGRFFRIRSYKLELRAERGVELREDPLEYLDLELVVLLRAELRETHQDELLLREGELQQIPHVARREHEQLVVAVPALANVAVRPARVRHRKVAELPGTPVEAEQPLVVVDLQLAEKPAETGTRISSDIPR